MGPTYEILSPSDMKDFMEQHAYVDFGDVATKSVLAAIEANDINSEYGSEPSYGLIKSESQDSLKTDIAVIGPPIGGTIGGFAAEFRMICSSKGCFVMDMSTNQPIHPLDYAAIDDDTLSRLADSSMEFVIALTGTYGDESYVPSQNDQLEMLIQQRRNEVKSKVMMANIEDTVNEIDDSSEDYKNAKTLSAFVEYYDNNVLDPSESRFSVYPSERPITQNACVISKPVMDKYGTMYRVLVDDENGFVPYQKDMSEVNSKWTRITDKNFNNSVLADYVKPFAYEYMLAQGMNENPRSFNNVFTDSVLTEARKEYLWEDLGADTNYAISVAPGIQPFQSPCSRIKNMFTLNEYTDENGVLISDVSCDMPLYRELVKQNIIEFNEPRLKNLPDGESEQLHVKALDEGMRRPSITTVEYDKAQDTLYLRIHSEMTIKVTGVPDGFVVDDLSARNLIPSKSVRFTNSEAILASLDANKSISSVDEKFFLESDAFMDANATYPMMYLHTDSRYSYNQIHLKNGDQGYKLSFLKPDYSGDDNVERFINVDSNHPDYQVMHDAAMPIAEAFVKRFSMDLLDKSDVLTNEIFNEAKDNTKGVRSNVRGLGKLNEIISQIKDSSATDDYSFD